MHRRHLVSPDWIAREIKLAARRLARVPTYTALVILSLGLGIALCSTAFSVVNGVMLRPLPYPAADELLQVWAVDAETRNTRMTVTLEAFDAWRAQAGSVAGIEAHNVWTPVLADPGGAERLTGERLSPGLLDLLGIAPMIGGGFVPDHAVAGNDRAVILGYGFWQRRFGGDRSVIGRTITLDDASHVVIGVMPRSFRHPDPHRPFSDVDVFAPLVLAGGNMARDVPFLRVVARQRSGIPAAEVEARLARILDENAVARSTAGEIAGVRAVPLREEFFRDHRRPALLLLAATGLVLLIITANVGNLVLVRAQSQGRDAAIRRALGASAFDQLRPLIAENAVLAATGAALGAAVVFTAGELLQAVAGRYLPVLADVRPDGAVLLFAVAVAFILTLGMAVIPSAMHRRPQIRALLAGGGATHRARGAAGGDRLRKAFGTAEIALAVSIAIGTALLTRSFLHLNAVDPGFGGPAITVEIITPSASYPDPERVVSLLTEIEERLGALPGVTAVGRTSDLPLIGQDRSWELAPASGAEAGAGTTELVEFEIVGPGYLRSMGIPVLAGREFDRRDATGEPVVIISERLSRQIAGDGRILERSVILPGAPPGERARVVGIAGDVLDDGLGAPPEPRMYLPHGPWPERRFVLVLRSNAPVTALAGDARRTIAAVDPGVAVLSVRTLDGIISESLQTQRLAFASAWIIGVLALLLAIVGVYGVIAYLTATRTREIGIRIALGASRRAVARLVLRDAVTMIVPGIALGVLIDVAATQVLLSMIFGIGPLDPPSFALAPVFVAVAALLAAYQPARRAMRLDPVEVIRDPG